MSAGNEEIKETVSSAEAETTEDTAVKDGAEAEKAGSLFEIPKIRLDGGRTASQPLTDAEKAALREEKKKLREEEIDRLASIPYAGLFKTMFLPAYTMRKLSETDAPTLSQITCAVISLLKWIAFGFGCRSDQYKCVQSAADQFCQRGYDGIGDWCTLLSDRICGLRNLLDLQQGCQGGYLLYQTRQY